MKDKLKFWRLVLVCLMFFTTSKVEAETVTDIWNVDNILSQDSDEKLEEEKELNLVPKIEAGDITNSSAIIYVDIKDYSIEDFDEKYICYLYRADKKDGLYKQVNDNGVYCLDSTGIVDKKLESGKTYYYKAKVDGTGIYSDIIEVNTKISSSKQVLVNDKIDKNPQTSTIYSFIILVIILTINVSIIVHIRKKYY